MNNGQFTLLLVGFIVSLSLNVFGGMPYMSALNILSLVLQHR